MHLYLCGGLDDLKANSERREEKKEKREDYDGGVSNGVGSRCFKGLRCDARRRNESPIDFP